MLVEEAKLIELINKYKSESEQAMNQANALIGAAQAIESLLSDLKHEEIGSIAKSEVAEVLTQEGANADLRI